MSEQKTKTVDKKTMEELEASKNAVLKRVAEKLKNKEIEVSANHYSHASGTSGPSGHTSSVY